jgi:ArsR family transcriptional regulator
MRDKIELFKVLSEQNRLRILMMLLEKPLCVCEITSILKLSTATVSNHLSFLRKAGFIQDEKEGKWVNYMIAKNIKDEIIADIIKLLPKWFGDELEVIEDLIKVKTVNRFEIILNDKEN